MDGAGIWGDAQRSGEIELMKLGVSHQASHVHLVVVPRTEDGLARALQ